MFRAFQNNKERRAYGGSAFIELQYCKLKEGTDLKKIVSLHKIRHWDDHSLYIYVDEIDEFYSEYRDVFNDLDLFGIHYYSPEQINDIVTKIERKKPVDYIALLEWLRRGKGYNGVYILGI